MSNASLTKGAGGYRVERPSLNRYHAHGSSPVDQSLRPAVDRAASPTIDTSTYRLMVESVSDYAIVLLDPDGWIRSWNAGAHRIKGYGADEAIGGHFSILYPDQAVADGLDFKETCRFEHAAIFGTGIDISIYAAQ